LTGSASAKTLSAAHRRAPDDAVESSDTCINLLNTHRTGDATVHDERWKMRPVTVHEIVVRAPFLVLKINR
jgi:hypothetical protein